MVIGFVEFEFDLPDALLGHLVTVLENMESAPLTTNNVKKVPEVQGIYQLFLGDDLVYIGKTDAQAGLKHRLTRHARTITHRKNLSPSDVNFKAVRVFVFTAIDLESQLIDNCGGVKAVPWNGSGFGANDPGRNRDTTKLKADGFDVLFPIDIDQTLEVELSAPATALEVLRAIGNAAPYTLRVEGGRSGHPQLREQMVEPPPPPHTMRSIISNIVTQLPTGWQATKLPARVIMYREHEDNYPGGEVIQRSS